MRIPGSLALLLTCFIGCIGYEESGPGTNPVSSLGVSFPWDATETLPGTWEFTVHRLAECEARGWSDSVVAVGFLRITRDTLLAGPFFKGRVVLDGISVIERKFRFQGTTVSVGQNTYHLELEFPVSTQSRSRWVCAGGELRAHEAYIPCCGSEPVSAYHLEVPDPG